MSERRNSQLIRALSLQRLLMTGRSTLRQMAQTMRVHKRTIYRDLAAFEEAHLPLRTIQGDDGDNYYTLQKAL